MSRQFIVPGIVALAMHCYLLPQTAATFAGELQINEIVSSNITGIPDEFEADLQNCPVPSCPGWYRALGESNLDGHYPDWIELVNHSDQAISLANYGLSDNAANPMKWQFPEGVEIPADGFLIVFASGKDKQGEFLHTNFKLRRGGEAIMLSAPDGTQIDHVAAREIPIDFSLGRMLESPDTWALFSEPTPGAANTSTIFPGFSESIEASETGGFHQEAITVTLSTDTGNGVIRYSTDGGIPTLDSTLYQAPIRIEETTVLRARSFKEGQISSQTFTATYLIGESFTMPVVSLSTHPDNLWDDAIGIYTPGPNARESDRIANYWNDWERPAHVEFFEADGTHGFAIDAGIKIFGWGSRSNGQKSFSVILRDRYGFDDLNYNLFPGSGIENFRAFLLRAAGGDSRSSGTYFRDPLGSWLIPNGNLDRQRLRPAIVFINGEYWGIQNIREKLNEDFLATHHAVDPDNVDMIQRYWRRRHPVVIEGDDVAFLTLEEFLKDAEPEAPGTFDLIDQTVDIDNFIDYMTTQIFCANYDWPGNNNKNWRPRREDGKWRWLMYDLDYTFNSNGNNGFSHNTLRHATTSTGSGWPNPSWTILIPDKLLEVPRIQHRFANRAADLLNTDFQPGATIEKLDALQALYAPEMERHTERWRRGGGISSVRTWERNVGTVRSFLERRPDRMFSHLRSFFRFSGTGEITIENTTPERGSVRLNSIKIERFPWTGTYFEEVPLQATPLPAPGYRFAGWSGTEITQSPTLSVVLPEDQAIILEATFLPDESALNAVVISEINYHSSDDADSGDWVELLNTSAVSVDLGGWSFMDAQENHRYRFPFGTMLGPNARIVLCSDKSAFRKQFPAVANCLGNIPFGLGNAGDALRLFDFSGLQVDAVNYTDTQPWPEAADGKGATLTLQSPATDNALPENWSASEQPGGTPGYGDGEKPPAESDFAFHAILIASDSVSLTLNTRRDETYTIQRSSDLTNWNDLKTVSGNGELVEFSDIRGQSATVYYRALKQP